MHDGLRSSAVRFTGASGTSDFNHDLQPNNLHCYLPSSSVVALWGPDEAPSPAPVLAEMVHSYVVNGVRPSKMAESAETSVITCGTRTIFEIVSVHLMVQLEITPFVGSGSIHEAMSVRGEFSTITSAKFLGAEGTDTRGAR